MRELIAQFVKFGFVGGLCFLIDFGLYTFLNYIGFPYLVSGCIGFVVSVSVNYILSMRYVFTGRDDISKQREFITFVVLSVIGLGLNELLLYLCVDQLYAKSKILSGSMGDRTAEMLAKVFATAVVMVYNFVTRKILLEEKKS